MATTDYQAARNFQNLFPHTFTAMEHLALAMDKAYKNRGKTSFFGHDRELKSYLKFEEKLKDTLLAMVMDGTLERSDPAEQFRVEFSAVLYTWAHIFPNWPEAYAYGVEKISDENGARQLIHSLVGARL